MLQFFTGIQLKKVKLTYSISETVIHNGPIIKLHPFNLPKGTVLLKSAQLQLAGCRGNLQDGQKT